MKNFKLLSLVVLIIGLIFSLNVKVSADPIVAVGEINNVYFNNVENWVDVDQSKNISVGDYFYGILHVQNIDGFVSGTIWGEDNVTPGLDTFTGYFLTNVTAVSMHGQQPHITLGPYTGGADPNNVLTNAELANGVVLKMWADSSTKWTDYISIAVDIANSTDGLPWATFTTNGGYWYTHAPLIPPSGAGNTVGESFLGLKIVDNFTGLNFDLVNDTNEVEINADVNLTGQSEITVGDNYWEFQSNDPVFFFPLNEYCGDGIVGNTPGETCDPPGSNQGQPNECRANCTYCGDGHLDTSEQCDDGNNANGDGCNANCTTESQGCTLTPGYWKTHSKYGPAQRDSTWDLITPNKEDSIFFLSGKTWYRVINTNPSGNAYYILSFQYIAAVLNKLSGAAVPADVQTAMDHAAVLFNMYAPSAPELKPKYKPQTVRQDFINTAAMLDNYNNGLLGIPHCD